MTSVSWRGNPAGAQAQRVSLALSGLTKERRFGAFPLCLGYKEMHVPIATLQRRRTINFSVPQAQPLSAGRWAPGVQLPLGTVGSGGTGVPRGTHGLPASSGSTALTRYAPRKCHHGPKNVPRGVVRGTSTSLPLWLRFGAACVAVALGTCSSARDGARCGDLQATPPLSRGELQPPAQEPSCPPRKQGLHQSHPHAPRR